MLVGGGAQRSENDGTIDSTEKIDYIEMSRDDVQFTIVDCDSR